MKADESQGCLRPSNASPPYGFCLGEVDAVRKGPKEIQSQTKTILESINTLYSI